MSITVCVFCGSRPGSNPSWSTASSQLGSEIAMHGWRLVFGGGGGGLMGELARGALASHGTVIGIIPNFLTEAEPVIQDLSELYVVESMIERKEMMVDVSDIFVVMPGGIGTIEELFEVWTGNHVKAYSKPILIVNLDGFFDELLTFAKKQYENGFLIERHFSYITVVNTIPEAIAFLQLKAR
ncbi:LOG family protein [Polynucleobacter acidiphobus]|uniref:LOG family protein n=1 Tax=Polynucleobacter acidiphobus TaxID=556053 RepID=UPI00131F02E2|nr:TIGR00730 family Rossman fold protein [Polynucleobacter acidiphobus]